MANGTHDPSILAFVKSYLRKLSPIPDEELNDFVDGLKPQSYRAGSYFTRIGDNHDRVGLVVQGVFRVYYLSSEGDVHIRNFCNEGMPVGSYTTILARQPAHVNIEALEDSLVLEFSYSNLENRFHKHASWERLGRRMAEDHYISRERREFHLLAFDAVHRYQKFLEDFPGLNHRVTQVNIASYIGVKPETLSRIIKKLS